MRLLWFGCFLFTLLSQPSNGGILRETLKEPEGPPVGKSDSLGFQKIASEPQPPSTHGLFGPHIKAPAPPQPGEGPQPPAAPDPYLLEIFEKSPDTFPAAYIEWQQQQQGDEDNEREGRATKRRSFTYDQFVTAAVVARLDLQRSVYTMFAPSDAYLKSLNISLSAMALKDPECVEKIVRSHTVVGRVALSDRMEDVAMSLEDSAVFICAKEANGVEVLQANIETDYGIVHIIDGLMDRPRLMDSCPQLRQQLSFAEGQQVENIMSNHSISLRKVSDEDLLASLEYEPSIRTNEIDHNTFVDVVVVPFPEESDPSLEANIPLELLVNIDNFAHAVKLTWQTEDNVIATLQSLGASTFLALLERSNLMMDTLTRQGPWTVFAPDNEAWQALPKEIFDHIVSDPVLLRQILTYHVVQANATRMQLINDEKLPSLYENRPIHINFYTDGWASWYTASGSMITNLDELASNGVVHVVKSVLLPPLGDFYSVVKWTPALQTAFSMLESVSNPVFTNDSVSLTAFLPVDSPVLDALLVGSSPSDVADILRRHVVRGTWFTSGLIDGDHLFTFDDQVLTVKNDADCVGINGACIAVRDITLTNGVLHVVDNLI